MSELCKWCAYEHSDCKGNKDIPYNMHCQYYKKPAVFNAKEAAQQIQFLRGVLDQVKDDYYKLKAKTEWIPVTERLPEIEDGSLISESVLGTDNYGNIRHVRLELRCVEPRFCTEEEGMGINIIAWMPLPEPYKDGGAE